MTGASPKKLCGLNYFLQSNTGTYQVLHALQDLPTSQQFSDAIRSRQTINLGQFYLILHEHIIGGWRDIDILIPHEAHHFSRIMRTYHTHFGVPLGNTSGWGAMYEHLRVVPPGKRLRVPSCTRPEILGSG